MQIAKNLPNKSMEPNLTSSNIQHQGYLKKT